MDIKDVLIKATTDVQIYLIGNGYKRIGYQHLISNYNIVNIKEKTYRSFELGVSTDRISDGALWTLNDLIIFDREEKINKIIK